MAVKLKRRACIPFPRSGLWAGKATDRETLDFKARSTCPANGQETAQSLSRRIFPAILNLASFGDNRDFVCARSQSGLSTAALCCGLTVMSVRAMITPSPERM
jgi:hypothetical protein